jgi:hypothetical protein
MRAIRADATLRDSTAVSCARVRARPRPQLAPRPRPRRRLRRPRTYVTPSPGARTSRRERVVEDDVRAVDLCPTVCDLLGASRAARQGQPPAAAVRLIPCPSARIRGASRSRFDLVRALAERARTARSFALRHGVHRARARAGLGRVVVKPLSSRLSSRQGNGCVRVSRGHRRHAPGGGLSCVDCHGGDGQTRPTSSKRTSSRPPVGTARTNACAAQDEDLAWRRFRNPMDLRVARLVCGGCHESEVRDVHTSLHATTAGHLSDGYYEMGLAPKKGSTFSCSTCRRIKAGGGRCRDADPGPALPRERRTHCDRLATHGGSGAQGVHAVPPVVRGARRARACRLRRRLPRRGLRGVPRDVRARRTERRARTRARAAASPATRARTS